MQFMDELPPSSGQRLAERVRGMYEEMMRNPGRWTQIVWTDSDRCGWFMIGDVLCTTGHDIIMTCAGVQYRNIDGDLFYRYVPPVYKPRASWWRRLWRPLVGSADES